MNIQLEEKKSVQTFREDILTGLKSDPKKLASKYFYDKNGDYLFQQIMNMPDYYLTNCELDIFANKTAQLCDLIIPQNEPFDLIELGAGDAMKSTYLLEHLYLEKKDFTYMPIDISGNILKTLEKNLSDKLPSLNVQSFEGEYFEMLEKAAAGSERKKVVLFLGGNIGNMENDEAQEFCRSLRNCLSAGDVVLMGFDLKKNPHTILSAYNDETGITAAFNLNLLTRINRELSGDFMLENFQHYQNYDPETGACRSYLVSLCNQKISVAGQIIDFKENELIDMEISRKFSESEISKLCSVSGFREIGHIKDSKKWFVDSAWKI